MSFQISEESLKPRATTGMGDRWRRVPRWQKISLAIGSLLVVIALAVGLGVGLSQRGTDDNAGSTDHIPTNDTSSSGSGGGSNGTHDGSLWTPKKGDSWQIELSHKFTDTSANVGIFDIDLFINNATTIDELHKSGKKVMCYFSAGSFEDWRPDASKFSQSDKGNPLDGWAGEWWLRVNSTTVRSIMLDRLDLAITKGCDGVDPDNVDGYDNDNGLGLTEADAISYVNFLADAAHGRNLSLGLKNAGAIVPSVISKVEWSVNEQCAEHKECDLFQPFIAAGKPVFHIEYPKQGPQAAVSVKTSLCSSPSSEGFSTILKNMNLDDWYEQCPVS